MRTSFLVTAIFSLFLLGAPGVRAQIYGPYLGDPQYQYSQYQNYLQWQEYLEYLRQTDPYYDLHVLHYELFLQPLPAISVISTLLLLVPVVIGL